MSRNSLQLLRFDNAAIHGPEIVVPTGYVGWFQDIEYTLFRYFLSSPSISCMLDIFAQIRLLLLRATFYVWSLVQSLSPSQCSSSPLFMLTCLILFFFWQQVFGCMASWYSSPKNNNDSLCLSLFRSRCACRCQNVFNLPVYKSVK